MENILCADEFIDVVTQDSNFSEQLSEGASDQVLQKEIVNDTIEIANDPNFQPPKIDFESIGEFCYESVELALKGNQDYKNLLEAIVVLEGQRTRAVKDLERLDTLQEEALADPFEFVERLRRKENLCFPFPQKVHPVPIIDWGKYALDGNSAAFKRHQVSQLKRRAVKLRQNNSKHPKMNVVSVETKPMTIIPLWTDEEQVRLKELLLKFPSESEDNIRWEKIAKSLGNHSPFEVAARVYTLFSTFVTDIGEKVGKLPDLQDLKKKWNVSKEEENNCNMQNGLSKETQVEMSDEEDVSFELQHSPEYQELMLLKKVLQQKIAEKSSISTQHNGYKCCRCRAEPIIGTRWHCVDCKPPLSTDFCEDCHEHTYETSQHSADHCLEPIVTGRGFLDRDYMHFMGSDYNYLDPNYMPAT